MCWFAFSFIIFHVLVIPIDAGLLSDNRQKAQVGGAASGRGRGNGNQDVLCEEENILNKR